MSRNSSRSSQPEQVSRYASVVQSFDEGLREMMNNHILQVEKCQQLLETNFPQGKQFWENNCVPEIGLITASFNSSTALHRRVTNFKRVNKIKNRSATRSYAGTSGGGGGSGTSSGSASNSSTLSGEQFSASSLPDDPHQLQSIISSATQKLTRRAKQTVAA